VTCRLLAVGLVSVLFACSSSGEPTEPRDPIPALRSSPASTLIPPASRAPQSASSDGGSVLLPQHRFVKRQGAVERSCPDPYSAECVQGYRSLAQLLRPEVSDWEVRDAETLRALRSRLEGGGAHESSTFFTSDWLDVAEGIAPDELRTQLKRRLNLEGLLAGNEVAVALLEREGGVAQGAGTECQYRQLELHLSHPRLGDFDAVIRLPRAEGVTPLLLVLPGHLSGDNFVEQAWRDLAGERMVAEGLGVVIARPRGADAEAVETAAALRLLSAGTSLIGAHIAEAWLLAGALTHLRAVGELPPGQTGLFGHSSGALAGNVLCHLASLSSDSRIEACVNDLWGNYFKLLCDGDRCWVLDETDPRLRGLRQPLSSTPSLPTLSPRPPYGLVAEDGSSREVDRVINFFQTQLR